MVERLCISQDSGSNVFDVAHDQHCHQGFHRSFARISAAFYIRRLSKLLRDHSAIAQTVTSTKLFDIYRTEYSSLRGSYHREEITYTSSEHNGNA